MGLPVFEFQRIRCSESVQHLKGIGRTGKEPLERNHKITNVGQLNYHLRKVTKHGGCAVSWLTSALGYFWSFDSAIEAIEDLQYKYY